MTAAAGPLVPGTGDAISPEQAGALTPGQARALFRDGLVTPTTGWSRGYVQANLVVLPRDWAFDMMLFARRNPAPVPLLDVTDPGSVSSALAPGADLRSDVPRYRVWRDGQLVDSPTDVTTLWREDLVAFLIGCSFTAEAALLRAGVPLRHLEQGRNVPMYTTAVPCEPAGRLAGPLVVSMRPLPAEFIGTAVEVTSRMPHAHGAPVHVGDPGTLGITDLSTPDFGDAVTPAPGDVPVFWACGVTPQAVLMQAAPPFAITHAPGHMFITDAPDDQHRMTSTDAPGEPDDPSRRTGGQR